MKYLNLLAPYIAMSSFKTALYPAIFLGILLLNPINNTIYKSLGFSSYIWSNISIACFLLFTFPFIWPYSTIFRIYYSPQLLPFFIQTLKHCRIFYKLAGTVYFNSPPILTSYSSELFSSYSSIFRRASIPESFSLLALDFSIWVIV